MAIRFDKLTVKAQQASQRLVQDPLAKRILEGEMLPGDTVAVDAAGGELRFARQPAPVAAD